MNTRFIRVVAISLLTLVSANSVAQQLIPSAVTAQDGHIVRLEVQGERFGKDTATKTKHGTGFYVSRSGFILTAGHVLSPRLAGEEEFQKWDKDSPRITVTHPGAAQRTTIGALIYFDEQVDLGLLKTESHQQQGVLKLGVYADLQSNQEIYALAFGRTRGGTDVVIRKGQVDTIAALGSNGRVRIDISSLKLSDSGSPIVNAAGRVIAVLSMGDPSESTATVAIPIPFAAPMLARVEIRNAEEEEWITAVNAVIEELRTDAFHFDASLHGDKSASSLTITFDKRLKTGRSPQRVDVAIALDLSNREIHFLVGEFEAKVSEIDTRGQQAIVSGIVKEILDVVEEINGSTELDDKIDITKIQNVLVMPTGVWKLVGEGGVTEKRVDGGTIEIKKDQSTFRFF